jgi:hypothetical protein
VNWGGEPGADEGRQGWSAIGACGVPGAGRGRGGAGVR